MKSTLKCNLPQIILQGLFLCVPEQESSNLWCIKSPFRYLMVMPKNYNILDILYHIVFISCLSNNDLSSQRLNTQDRFFTFKTFKNFFPTNTNFVHVRGCKLFIFSNCCCIERLHLSYITAD